MEVNKNSSYNVAEDVKSQRAEAYKANTTHDVTETISEHSFKTIPKAPKLLFSVQKIYSNSKNENKRHVPESEYLDNLSNAKGADVQNDRELQFFEVFNRI